MFSQRGLPARTRCIASPLFTSHFPLPTDVAAVVAAAANAISRQVASWQFSLISRPPGHVSALWRGELLKHYFAKEIEMAHTHSYLHGEKKKTN